MTCDRWVCIHGDSGTRFEVGDSWWEGDRICHCHHVSMYVMCNVTVCSIDHLQDGKITCTENDETPQL